MAKESRRRYQTDLPSAKTLENWRSLVEMQAVKSVAHMLEIYAQFTKMGSPDIAIDTETTSLSTIDADLVGISFCFEPKKAWYIPLTHRVGTNAITSEDDFREMLTLVYAMAYASSRSLWFNCPYDFRILRKYGFDPLKTSHLDIQDVVWNLDTNINLPSLKWASEYFLGVTVKTYAETAGKVIDFSYVDAEDAVEYAATDAWTTFMLRVRFREFHERIKFIIEVDNELKRAMMYLEETPLYINKHQAEEMRKVTEAEIEVIKKEVFEIIGQPIQLNAPAEVASAMVACGVPLTVTTPKGKRLSTKEDVIADFKDDHPIVAKVLEYRGLIKRLSSYIMPFLKMDKDYVFISYKLNAAPTARLASGSESKKNKGTKMFMPFNIQSTIKPKPAYYLSSVAPCQTDETVLGYEFSQCERDTPNAIEGYEQKNIRRFFRPHPDHYCLSIDYDSEELRICGNITGDRTFLDAFIAGEDPHVATAKRMFEVYDMANRKIAKNCNFSLLYLGNAWTLKGYLPDKTIEELQVFVDKWLSVHVQHMKYLASSAAYARKTGFTTTLLGRIRRVGTWYKSPQKRDWGFADRTVMNTQVQGLAGDIMRVVLVRLFREIYLNPRYEGKVHFMSSLHDEVNFSVTKDPAWFTEIYQKISHIMTDLPFDWEVPLTVSPSVGVDWGMLFPFTFENNMWVPEVA